MDFGIPRRILQPGGQGFEQGSPARRETRSAGTAGAEHGMEDTEEPSKRAIAVISKTSVQPHIAAPRTGKRGRRLQPGVKDQTSRQSALEEQKKGRLYRSFPKVE